jgi:hypothetical protein
MQILLLAAYKEWHARSPVQNGQYDPIRNYTTQDKGYHCRATNESPIITNITTATEISQTLNHFGHPLECNELEPEDINPLAY